MKNLIIILLIVLLGSCAVHKKLKNYDSNIRSNQIKPYKLLEKFKGDTLAFMQQSIFDRKAFYRGKKFSILLRDLSIPVLSYTTMSNDKGIIATTITMGNVNLENAQSCVIGKSLEIVWQKPITNINVLKKEIGLS